MRTVLTTTKTPNKASLIQEIGYVTSVRDYLVEANGLPNAKINEIILSEQGARGMIIGLKESQVELIMLDKTQVKPQETFTRTFRPLSISLGSFLLGRAINPIGTPIDGKTPFPKSYTVAPIEQPIRGIKTREFIKHQFETGVTTIDTLIPIAQGQRQLIMGDARSGKTSFLIDLVVNQREKGVICIFALIGKSGSSIKRLVDILSINRALPYTCIVAASSSELPSLIYLTPAVAFTIAEYFQSQGKDVLLILDDLGSHARFFREISLLSNRTPGRESYPGDIFYQHAHLLERAGAFNSANGGGSITALPVIETNMDDYTGFIPTNLMAMTDGHLLFNSALYHQGTRPAIDISLSVSRVGRQTQMMAQKLLSDKVRSILARAEKLETLSRFGSEISSQTQILLKQSHQIKIILKQPPLQPIPPIIQMVLLGLTFTPFFSSHEANFVESFKTKILNFLLQEPNLIQYTKQVTNMKDDKEFLKSLDPLLPILEKLCQT